MSVCNAEAVKKRVSSNRPGGTKRHVHRLTTWVQLIR